MDGYFCLSIFLPRHVQRFFSVCTCAEGVEPRGTWSSEHHHNYLKNKEKNSSLRGVHTTLLLLLLHSVGGNCLAVVHIHNEDTLFLFHPPHSALTILICAREDRLENNDDKNLFCFVLLRAGRKRNIYLAKDNDGFLSNRRSVHHHPAHLTKRLDKSVHAHPEPSSTQISRGLIKYTASSASLSFVIFCLPP
jgi:hypothetical protein